MISVSEAAAEVLQRTVESLESGESLRLARSTFGDFGLAVDEEQADDVRVDFGDGAVLIVGPTIEGEFEGAVLDITDDDGAARLVLRVRG